MTVGQDEVQSGGGQMNVLARLGGILLRPATEWQSIAQEDGELSYVLNIYVAILAAVPALAGLVGFSAIGAGVPNVGTVRVPVFSGLAGAVFGYVFAFVSVYLIAVIINLFAGRYGGTKSFSAALKLAVYSYTPVWVTGVFLLLPGLRFLTVLGLYGCYLLWVGLPVLMKAPREQLLRYTATVVAAALIVRFLIGSGEAVLFSLPAAI
jgi:hypothetical protein